MTTSGGGGADETEDTLSARVDGIRREVEALIKDGIEAPTFEFKRACSISRENLEDRLDFVKLIQGVANADIVGERFIIIGGDPGEKRFFSVSNSAEFDHANFASVIGKYLDPIPQFEIFNNLSTSDGVNFVLIVIGPNQPRPIVVKAEGKKSDGRTRLQVGDIWIKKGTSLQLAVRSDLDAMYRQRMEEEAEDRARKRFKHFNDISGLPSSVSRSAPRMPARDLLVGPQNEFRRFVEELLVASDKPRLRMLLEIARESLVEEWGDLDVKTLAIRDDNAQARALGVFRDVFLPSVQSLVSLGMLIVKYEGEIDWLNAVVDVLLEGFEASRRIESLTSHYLNQPEPQLSWWRPGFEIFLGARCLASYIVSRSRLQFLAAVLPRMVLRLENRGRQELRTPILFWPLPSGMFPEEVLGDGRSSFYWGDRIAASWGSYFGSEERFLASSCQLEFLLELNSYFGVNHLHNAAIEGWLSSHARDVSFIYNPDLFRYPLDLTLPMADFCYNAIASGHPFPNGLAVEPELWRLAFENKNLDQRLAIYGGFLDHLKSWQSTAMMQMRRFPFMFSWEGRLGEAVAAFRAERPPVAGGSSGQRR